MVWGRAKTQRQVVAGTVGLERNVCLLEGRRGLMSFLAAPPFLSTDPAGREALRRGLGLQDPMMSSLAGGFEAGITVTDKDAEVQRGPGSCPRPPSSETRGLATVP